jgi:tetratricopeptide (TPR) repeat protein
MKHFRTATFIVFALVILYVGLQIFQEKEYNVDVEKLLKVEKLVEERDEILEMHQRYIKALNSLRYKVDTIGDRIMKKIEAARTLQKTGDQLQEHQLWDLALKNYEIGLKIYPQDPILNYKMGLALANMGMIFFEKVREYWKRAEEHYLKAIHYGPDFSMTYYALSLLYLNYYEKNVDRNKLPLALNRIQQYISQNSDNPKAYFIKGRIHYHMGNPALALESYQVILGLVPDDTPEYQNALKNIRQIQQEQK